MKEDRAAHEGQFSAVSRNIFICFCLRFPFLAFLSANCNNKLTGPRHCSWAGIGPVITGGGKEANTGGRGSRLRTWGNYQNPHTSAFVTKERKRAWRERPGQPGETPICLSVGKGGRGLPKKRAGEGRGKEAALPAQRKGDAPCTQGASVPCHRSPLPPQCLFRKTNPRKPKQNKLLFPPPKYI